jgi:hypothetical protein
MTYVVSNKINMIYNRLKDSKYIGNIRCRHFAVAIRGGKVVSPVSCNYYRTNVFGKIRGTIHAEMNSLSYVLNTDNSVNGYNNHKIQYTLLLQSKGI